MPRIPGPAALLVIAAALALPASAHADGFGSRAFTMTLEGVETHTFRSGGPPEGECRNGDDHLSRGSGKETWSFRTARPTKVTLTDLGSSTERAFVGKGLSTGVPLTMTSTREGALEAYACGQPDYTPTWSPAPLAGCWGTSPMTSDAALTVGQGQLFLQPREPEGWPGCGWPHFKILSGSSSELILAAGRTSFGALIRAKRPVTVKLAGTTRCNSTMMQSVCNGTVAATMKLVPRGPRIKPRRQARARAAQAAPDGQAPHVTFRPFEHWMSAEQFAALQIPVKCTEPAAVRISFSTPYGGPRWDATGQAGPEGALVPAAVPKAMVDWLVGKGRIRIPVEAWCIDAAGEESAVRWLTSLTVSGSERKQIGSCKATYRKTYRLKDLLGPGIAVPVRCDGATRAGVLLLITNEEELGIPTDLWRRHAGMRNEDWSGPGTRTLRLKAAAWTRRYWRRARKPVDVTLSLGIKTNQEGRMAGTKGTRARVLP